MKIFGLIYTIVVSIGAFFHTANVNKENEENKIRYRQPDGLTYFDVNGRTRFLSNNELAFYRHRNGDYVLEDMAGRVYRNFSEEQRIKECNERKEKALSNSETTYCIDNNDHRHDWVCKGKRFKDFETGDIYVVRFLKFKYYYINISNGMIVRETDYQRKLDEYKKMKNAKIYSFEGVDIEEFNEKQKTVQDKNKLYRDYDYTSDCDMCK